MCDLLVALPDSTRNGYTLFGKNSDRPAGESQVLYFSSGRERGHDSAIQCSYVEVPDVDAPLATLGCRPYWSWGYETGINEAGVVGGNAAIYTRSFRQSVNREKPGLTGMELLRLGLERGRTAEEVLDVITGLLEQYGQWGSAVQGLSHEEGSYDNSFLLADAREAWVVETTGRRWVAQKVKTGVRSISNEPTIRKDWDKCSEDLEEFARGQGWWNPREGPFDFAYAYGDHEGYSRQVSHIRWRRTCQLLEKDRGELRSSRFMEILRDHYENTFFQGPQFHPYLPDFHSICMHASPAGFTWGNTATSVVTELDMEDSAPSHLWVGYLPPCTGVYLAFPFSGDLPEAVVRVGKADLEVMPAPDAIGDEFDSASLWWRLYRILEEVKGDPLNRQAEVREALDPLERRYLDRVKDLISGRSTPSKQAWNNLVQEEVDDVMTALEELEKRWEMNPTQ